MPNFFALIYINVIKLVNKLLIKGEDDEFNNSWKYKKTYSEKVLLNDVSFGINDGDKIGLIGLNGSGKSTLLKIITGRDEFFDGSITKGKGVRVEYLSQNSEFDANATVLEQVFNSDTPEMKLLMEYENLLDKTKNEEFNEDINNRLIKTQEKLIP